MFWKKKKKAWKQHDKANYSRNFHFKFVEGKKTTTVTENAKALIYLPDEETHKWAALPNGSVRGTVYVCYVPGRSWL